MKFGGSHSFSEEKNCVNAKVTTDTDDEEKQLVRCSTQLSAVMLVTSQPVSLLWIVLLTPAARVYAADRLNS